MLSSEEIEKIFKDFGLLEIENREKILYKNLESRKHPKNKLKFTTTISNVTREEHK